MKHTSSRFFATIVAFVLLINTINAQTVWNRLNDFPGGKRLSGCSFSINGNGYMGLGVDTVGNTPQDWYEYNQATDTWTLKAPFPGLGRWLGVSFVINGKGYVATGSSASSGLLNDIWEYDPTLDHWTQKSSMPSSARQSAFAYVSDSIAYLGCGFIGGSSNISDFWQYNPRTDLWAQLSDYPGTNSQAQFAFSLSGMGYVGMGCGVDALTYSNEFYQYNPIGNSWTAKAIFPGATLQNSFCTTIKNEGYVLNGVNSNQGSPIGLHGFFKYNASSNSWYTLDSFTGKGRGYSTGFVLGDTIYFGLGANATGAPSLDSEMVDFWRSSELFATGINNNINAWKEVKLYPNPSNAGILYTQSVDGVFSYALYDVSGKLIKEYAPVNAGTKMVFDITGLSTGVYEMQALDKKSISIWTQKVVKE